MEYSLAAADFLKRAEAGVSDEDFPEGLGFSGDLCHKTNPPTHNLGMEYVCETTSLDGLVQLLACNLLPHGYWFYVTGWVPLGKDPKRVDAKLMKKYGIDVCRAERSRRKRAGYANLRYLRHGRFFILLATHGKHRFFEEEAALIRDIRHRPLRVSGYSISFRRGGHTADRKPDAHWHSHVEIDREWFNRYKAWFGDMAVRESTERLTLEFYRFPFEPYAPVRRQMLTLLRLVNSVRKRAGHEQLPYTVLPLRRRIVRPFDHNEETVQGRKEISERRPAVGPK